MRNLLAKFRFRTRWQICGRVLPALLVALASAAVAGWLAADVRAESRAGAAASWWLVGATVLAVAAMAAVLIGLGRIVDRNSRRLTALSGNMEALARGDYARRMPRGDADEVGRLVGYFNLMAASLEEAHRQVKDQAAHLKAALENMRMLDKAKDDFLVLVSHEVRTPLTAMLGGVNYLKSAVDKAEPAERGVLERLNFPEIAEIIASSGERLNGFMTDAIQMTAIQSGERRLDLAPVAPTDAAGARRWQRIAPLGR